MSAVNGRGAVCYLESLPYELLLKIYSMLSNRDKLQLKIVCKRFYQVANDKLLWRHIHWSHFTSSDLPSLRNLLVQFSDIVTVLRVSGNIARILELKEHILRCEALKILSLLGVAQSIVAVQKLVAGLPNLTSLEIESCNSPCSMLQCVHVVCSAAEWRDFIAAVAHLSLLSVVIPLSHNIAQFFINVWAAHNYYPSQFRICIFNNEIPSDVSSWSAECARFLVLWRESQYTMPSCDHLAQFQLGLFRPITDSPSVELNMQPSPTAVQTALVLGRLENLESVIRMSGAAFGTEAYTTGHYTPIEQLCFAENEALMRSFQAYDTSKIKCLNFSNAVGLLSVHLEAIANSCPLLTLLNFKGCTKSLATLFGMAAIADRCRELKAINLHGISRSDVEDLEELWRIFSQIKKLEHLALNPCLVPQQSEQILSDESIAESDLSAIRRLTSVDYQSKISSKNVECQLCTVSMNGVGYFQHLWVYLRHLRVENLSPAYCGSVVNSALIHCHALKTLYLDSDWCFPLSPVALACSNLEQLCLKCRRMNVTNDLIHVLTEVNKLTHLYLFVRSISKSSIYSVLGNLTGLMSCHIYCRDRPVMQPPDAALYFNKKMKELINTRTPSLDDFIFEEETTSHLYVNKRTAKSMLNSELVSVW